MMDQVASKWIGNTHKPGESNSGESAQIISQLQCSDNPLASYQH